MGFGDETACYNCMHAATFMYCIAGNFREFRGSGSIRESFLHEKGARESSVYHACTYARSSIVGVSIPISGLCRIHESFSTKSHISLLRERFLPQRFPATSIYTVSAVEDAS